MSLLGKYDLLKDTGEPCRPSKYLFQIIEDIVAGFAFLKNKNVTHGNMRPDDILIFEEKFSDSRLNRLRAKLLLTTAARVGNARLAIKA
ncbi:hypothetical protein A2U01_0057508 [Trifolium medium]|uniref:Protein kinase domain-containing protein n=1 Tax=Trifolium medium TaxID=97028 RepID=A0A392RL75_9FABA|nr:hypothetical protein [Trifolium medium]